MGHHSVNNHSSPTTHAPDTTHKPDETNNSKKNKKKDDSNTQNQDQLNALIVNFAISIMQKSIAQAKEVNADLKAEDPDAF
ncbi:hypothetical protein V8G57_00225 [Collimonas sp. H4R21]|jgi:hypothetical protein|uniref:Uncharacterized protein n=1 Tax=Collimonas rhizosphaerae TaxID=3126357 RepID=A0ABU9PP74_9BURK|nr:hypothetical protein [Collimonas sp. OK412]SFC95524.1 hypothetical protein SAMN04515619_11765 [Collimonas sp. OK412]